MPDYNELTRDQQGADRPPDAEEHGHAPGRSADLRELTPEDALARLRNGDMLQNVRVTRLTFKGEFDKPVRLKHCILTTPRFDGATFQADVQMFGCTLDRPHFNRRTTFERGLSLNGTTMLRPEIRDVTVKGPCDAAHFHPRGRLLMARCTFESRVSFWEAHFGGWANFKDCTFAGEADFRTLHAEQGVVFDRCVFRGPALFRGASIAKKLDMTGSRFESVLDLSKAKLHDFTYLEGIEQGPDQRFAFQNAVADRILVQPEQLAGRLVSEQKGEHETAMREYGLLKSSFQNLHRFDQEDWAFYRFKVNQRRGINRSWKRPWTKVRQFFNWLFLDLGCGYGTDPVRAVRAAFLIIFVFAAIYMAGIEHFYVDKAKLPFAGGELTDWPNRIAVGLLVSVSAFTSGLGGMRDLAEGWINIPLGIEALLGTFLWGLFIVAFSRKVIR